jgi:hypothetical protein
MIDEERYGWRGKEKESKADPRVITMSFGFKASGIRGLRQEEKTTRKELNRKRFDPITRTPASSPL